MKRVVCLVAAILPVGAQQQAPQPRIQTFDVKVDGPGSPAGDVVMFRNAVPAMPFLTADPVGFVSMEMSGALNVKGAPYSAEITTESVQNLTDGNRILHKSTQNVYRDAEGRSRREMNVEIPGQADENHKVIFIEDPVAGVHYVLNSKEKTARRMPMPRWEAANVMSAPVMPRPGNRIAAGGFAGAVVAAGPAVSTTVARMIPDNVATESLGTQNIEGVAAKGTKTTVTIPAGQIGNERPLITTTENWFSEDLKISVLSKRSDPRFGDSSTKATSLRRGDQPGYLFEVPSDYKLVEMPGPMERIRIESKAPEELL